jgi:hypothetical protein
MAEQRLPIRLWIIALALMLMIGFGVGANVGFDRAPGKFRFDTEKITSTAESCVSAPERVINVYRKDGNFTSVTIRGPATEYRDLLLTLAPIKGSRVGAVRFPKYELLFQAGKSPVVINVRQIPEFDELNFDIGGIWYVGGSSS